MEEEISRMFQGCFLIKGVSRVFQGSFKKTFKLSRCLKKVSCVWHSSQLPEQKEGLFFENSSVLDDHFQQNETGFQLQQLSFAASVRKTYDLTLQPRQPGSNLVYLRLGLGSVRIRPVCLTPHLHIDTQSTRLALIVGSGTQSRHLWTVPISLIYPWIRWSIRGGH